MSCRLLVEWTPYLALELLPTPYLYCISCTDICNTHPRPKMGRGDGLPQGLLLLPRIFLTPIT